MLINKFKSYIIFFLLLTCLGCLPKQKALIEVDMERKEAEALLKKHRAPEQILEMIPPPSPNGGYMQLSNYKISDNAILTVISDEREGKVIVIDLTLITQTHLPKHERTYQKIDYIDLNDY